MSKYLWIIDAGHGGIIDGEYQTAGKRSPVWNDGSQLFEGEFNRKVQLRLVELMNCAGFDWTSNTTSEHDIHLRQRTDFANNMYRLERQRPSGERRKVIFVSIHANAFKDSAAQGWCIYTGLGETRSDAIAEVFYEVAEEMLPEFRMRKDLSDGDHDYEANFWVLRKTVMPAVLTENLFMTNERECAWLLTDEGVERIAQLHFEAIKRIEESEKRYA